MTVDFLQSPSTLPAIKIGATIFNIEIKKETIDDAGKPAYMISLVAQGKRKLVWNMCALRLLEVTDIKGDTLENLTTDTQMTWVVIARNKSGVLQGKFAYFDDTWQKAE